MKNATLLENESLERYGHYSACRVETPTRNARYTGECNVCGQIYIGETKHNVEVHWEQQKDTKAKSERAQHLQQNPTHSFSWSILLSAPQNTTIRRNLEASVVALCKPKLNNQLESKKLSLFRHGVT